MMSTRIGLIVPSSNTVCEPDFYTRLPDGCALHTARMFLEETTPEGESVMLDEHVPRAIVDLATARPDVVVFGCTSAGALRGNEYEAGLIERISDQTGAPTVSVAASVRRTINSQKPDRVGVITPYVDSLNEKIRESLEADGVSVTAIHGLGIDENFAIAEVEPERIVSFATECFSPGDIDLLFASCTNFRAFDAREEIHQALGLPVVTSNQAALAAVLDHLGVPAAA
jgi:maleate isomerase